MAAAILFTIAAPAYAETYQYDDLNRLIEVNYENGTVIEYTYDPAGNMLSSTTTPGLAVEKIAAADGVVSGEAAAGSSIKVLANGEVVGTAVVGEDRFFTISLSGLQSGQVLTIQALKEGAVFTEMVVTVDGDTNSPDPDPTPDPEPSSPKVGTIDDSSSSIVGTASPGETVKVYYAGEVVATGTADDEGIFTIALPEDIKAGEELEIVSVSDEGVESKPAKVTIVAEEERTTRIKAKSVRVTNNQTLIDDEIVVSDVMEGDVVKVYRSSTGTELLAEKTVPNGESSVTLLVEELGKEEGSVYITVTSPGKVESTLTKVQYGKEPGGEDECAASFIFYGTKFASVLPVLRTFRDDVLMSSVSGKNVVKLYYSISPSVINLLK